MAYIGIDFGTSNSVVANFQYGQAEVLPNHEGGKWTPSVVTLRRDGSLAFGQEAKENFDEKRSIRSIKRILGTPERVPLVGQLLRLAGTAQFAHSLSVLLASGITLVEGLRTVADLLRNRYLAQRVGEARAAVLRGAGLAPALAVPGAFMPMLSPMVAVGESAGTLDDVLLEVARFHESQLQAAIRRLSVLIEPVIAAGGSTP